jgi:hypothetical protein
MPHLVNVHAPCAVVMLQQHISHMQLQRNMQAGSQPVGLNSSKHLAWGEGRAKGARGGKGGGGGRGVRVRGGGSSRQYRAATGNTMSGTAGVKRPEDRFR